MNHTKILLSITILLTLLLAGTAYGFSVRLNDTDNFYSPYSGSINVLVNTSGLPQNASYVVADFGAITNLTCHSTGSPNDTLAWFDNSSASIWNYTCDASPYIANFVAPVNGSPVPKNINVVVLNSTGDQINLTSLVVVLQDMGVPNMGPNPCQRFGSLTTNFSQVLDFAHVNFIIQIELNGSCLTGPGGGSSPWDGYSQVMMMNFSSLNMSKNSTLQKLQGLKDALQVNITPPHERGLTRVYLNDTAFAELNTNTTITLSKIPFAAVPAIFSDNASRSAANVTWTLGTPFNISILLPAPRNILVPQGTLQFRVTGFSGYNVTDNQTPIITLNAPLNNSYSNNNNTVFNVTLNGTGSQISAVNFSLDAGGVVASYSNVTNSANCVYAEDGSELSYCVFSWTAAPGTHNMTVLAYDYGGNSPGNNATSFTNFTIDVTPPTLTFVSINSSNANNSLAIVGSRIVLKFNSSKIINNASTVVTIAGQAVSTVSMGLFAQNATYTMTSSDTQGNVTYTILLYDQAGNNVSTSNTSNIFFDDPPSGTVNLNTTTFVSASTTQYPLSGTNTFTPGGSGVDSIRIFVNNVFNGSASFNGTPWNYTLFNLTPGIFNISVRINDSVGNVFFLNNTLIVDNVAPTINLSAPNSSNKSDSVITLTFTPADPAGITNCWYSYGNATNMTANISVACSNNTVYSTILYLTNNTYTIFAYANDSLGNVGVANVTFLMLDNTPPTINTVGTSSYGNGHVYDYTTLLVTLNITTNENATCDYSASNVGYAAMSSTFSTTGALQHYTDYPVVSSTTSATSYTVYVSCQDLSGNAMTTNSQVTFTVAQDTSGSGSGSGGGGGGGGGGGSSTGGLQDSASLIYSSLPAGTKDITMNMLLSDIILTTNNDSSNVHFTITKTDTAVPLYTNGTVYTYLEVEHENLASDSVTSATLKFQVEKSWLTTNGFDKADVMMLRQSNGWTPLTTTVLSDDATYVYYRAESPGLSTFAIAAKKSAAPKANATTNASNATTNVTGTAVNNNVGTGANEPQNNAATTTSKATRPPNWSVFIIVIVLMVAIAIMMYLYHGKKKQIPTAAEVKKDTEASNVYMNLNYDYTKPEEKPEEKPGEKPAEAHEKKQAKKGKGK